MLTVLIFLTLLCVDNNFGKKLVDINDFLQLVDIKDLLQYVKDNLDNCKGKHVYRSPGTVYTRWGAKTCGNKNAKSELIYAGQVTGSNSFQHSGAAVNYLCLPQTPIYGHYDSNENSNAYLYGAVIQNYNIDIPGTPFEHAKYNEKSIYCAVCRTMGRSSVLMIPGRNQCFSGWKREYYGYLAAGHPSHAGASEFICLDKKPDIFPMKSLSWHKILYSTEARCTGPLKCPPYVNGRELTCVVCSK